LRQWNNRPLTPAQFDLHRVRQIGEWGHASRHIGRRWELVGLELLKTRVADRQPTALLAICADDRLAAALASTGSKNPDVVLAFAGEDTVALEPADLKWSLDVADYRQISATVLAALLAKSPVFCASIRTALPPDLGEWAWVPRDGFFFCPKSISNERFLVSPDNLQQEYPIEAKETQFQDINAYDFFEPLPGWLTGGELARLDGATRGLSYLDNADRYYHLGCGVAGALLAIGRSIFEDEVDELDPAAEVSRFRAYLAAISPPSTATVIERLGGLMRMRQAAQRDLRDITRSTLAFKEFAAEIVLAGRAAPEDAEAALRRTWGETYRTLLDGFDRDIRAAGRKMLSKGASDADAIEALKSQRDAYGRRLRARARVVIQNTPAEVTAS
jgi:hypothetical protein